MRRVALAALGTLVLLAACWRTRPNPSYCELSSDCTGAAPICDPVAHVCVTTDPPDMTSDAPALDLTGACAASSECPLDKPICDGTCRACTSGDDATCAMLSAATPVCATLGPNVGQCAACAPQATALESTGCATASTPVCDTNGTCRACATNAECMSGVCDSGACVKEADVAYVDKAQAPCAAADGTRTKAFCEVSAALATATSYIHVAGNSMPYAAITLTDRSVTIVGPGKSAMPTARLFTASQPAVDVNVTTGMRQVVLDGLDLGGVGAARGLNASTSSGTAADAKVTVRDCVIHEAQNEGIKLSGATLNISASTIRDNIKGGVALTSSSNYNIENNFIVSNLSATSPGLYIDNTSTGSARFNTFTKNSNTGGVGAIICVSSRDIVDSIVVANVGVGANQVSGCNLVRVVTGGTDGATGSFATTPSFVSTTDFHLKPADAANKDCCVDKLMTGPTLDIDGSKRPKGATSMFDIGAHEVE